MQSENFKIGDRVRKINRANLGWRWDQIAEPDGTAFVKTIEERYGISWLCFQDPYDPTFAWQGVNFEIIYPSKAELDRARKEVESWINMNPQKKQVIRTGFNFRFWKLRRKPEPTITEIASTYHNGKHLTNQQLLEQLKKQQKPVRRT